MKRSSIAPTQGRAAAAASPAGWAILPLAFLLIAIGLLPGCSVLGKSGDLFARKTPTVVQAAQTNYVPVVVTNYVGVTRYLTNYITLQEATTNANTGVVTPAIIQPMVAVTNTVVPMLTTNLQAIVLPAKTYDALSLSPVVTGAVQVAGDLAPVPWAHGVGELLLATVGGVFAFINHRRAKKALGEKEQWRDTAATVIQNFEHLRAAAKKLPAYTEQMDTDIMRVVTGMQYAVGVKPLVEEVVQAQKVESTLG